MFDPMELGRQIRAERQQRGCGFCGLADNGEKSQPYQQLTPNPQVADKVRTIADNTPLDKIRNSSANHPQATKPTTTGLSANPQNPQGEKPADNASPQQVEAILAGLVAAGRDLGTIESAVRWTMQSLSREAAAELAVALDDAFEVAADDRAARSQCRRLLNNPEALAAARAVWPDLPTPLPDAPAPAQPTARPAVDHAPRWLRLIRERCPLLPEDEAHMRRHLGRLAPGDALARAERYAVAWEQAAQAEPRHAARDNAGRRAANTELRVGERHA